MNADSRKDSSDLSLEWVKRQLRSLATISPPERLRSKLAGGVPHTAGRRIEKTCGQGRLRWFSYVGAAAVVIILVSILRLKAPLRPAQGPIIDINDRSSRALAADHNSLASVDMNVSEDHCLY